MSVAARLMRAGPTRVAMNFSKLPSRRKVAACLRSKAITCGSWRQAGEGGADDVLRDPLRLRIARHLAHEAVEGAAALGGRGGRGQAETEAEGHEQSREAAREHTERPLWFPRTARDHAANSSRTEDMGFRLRPARPWPDTRSPPRRRPCRAECRARASAISTTPSVPSIIGALTWPIWAMRNPLPSRCAERAAEHDAAFARGSSRPAAAARRRRASRSRSPCRSAPPARRC